MSTKNFNFAAEQDARDYQRGERVGQEYCELLMTLHRIIVTAIPSYTSEMREENGKPVLANISTTGLTILALQEIEWVRSFR